MNDLERLLGGGDLEKERDRVRDLYRGLLERGERERRGVLDRERERVFDRDFDFFLGLSLGLSKKF